MERFFTLAPLCMCIRLLVDASRLELERVEKWTTRRGDDEVQHHRGAERMTCSYAATAYLQRIHALQGGAAMRCAAGEMLQPTGNWRRENAPKAQKTSLPNENVRAVGVGWDVLLFRVSVMDCVIFLFLNLINESLN
jgi:hypothetical protein